MPISIACLLTIIRSGCSVFPEILKKRDQALYTAVQRQAAAAVLYLKKEVLGTYLLPLAIIAGQCASW